MQLTLSPPLTSPCRSFCQPCPSWPLSRFGTKLRVLLVCEVDLDLVRQERGAEAEAAAAASRCAGRDGGCGGGGWGGQLGSVCPSPKQYGRSDWSRNRRPTQKCSGGGDELCLLCSSSPVQYHWPPSIAKRLARPRPPTPPPIRAVVGHRTHTTPPTAPAAAPAAAGRSSPACRTPICWSSGATPFESCL